MVVACGCGGIIEALAVTGFAGLATVVGWLRYRFGRGRCADPKDDGDQPQ